MDSKPSDKTLDYVDLFEHAPTGYAVLDGVGCIEKINHVGAALLGWQANWLVGQPFSRWLVNSDREPFIAHLRQLGSSAGGHSATLRIKNRQGRLLTLWLQSQVVMGQTNANTIIRTIMVDISGEQASARKLRSLQSQLAHLSRLNTAGELAASLAHELNQPLGTVVLNCDAALRLLGTDPYRTDEVMEVLSQAKSAATFASDIVRHLRSFLRDEDEQSSACEFSGLIKDVSVLIEAEAKDNDIELEIDIDPDLPPICADPVQIGQVLVNLAHNSIEAFNERTCTNKRVVIAVKRLPPDRIWVSVTDTGPGIHPHDIEQIFSPFYTTKNHGMGLGLSISRSIIEAHGGKLWATQGMLHGATVEFTLPTPPTSVGEPHAD
ncbi:sensor histidine kinase [Marinobacter caseinilyticus]|uniref:sensor histidine kinase n=1 Tax=Marinobacter caseinilyticus TaxID=2692195 RepID=UPI00140DEA88|nr:ATP-binding protein [Marinobacter caseinilyticus]